MYIPLKGLVQGSPNLVLDGRWPAEYRSNFPQHTCLEVSSIPSKTFISWFECDWLGLELNYTGHWSSTVSVTPDLEWWSLPCIISAFIHHSVHFFTLQFINCINNFRNKHISYYFNSRQLWQASSACSIPWQVSRQILLRVCSYLKSRFYTQQPGWKNLYLLNII